MEESRPMCSNCKKIKIEDDAFDSVFQLNCNQCCLNMKKTRNADWCKEKTEALSSCSDCLKSFKKVVRLVKHKCSRPNVHACFCGVQLDSDRSLNQHYKFRHRLVNVAKVPEFEMCDVNIVPGKSLAECVICDKKMAKSSLKRHMLYHAGGGKQYSCKVCQKKFIHSSALNRHMLVHTIEQLEFDVLSQCNVKCPICDKFLEGSGLRRHLIQHLKKSKSDDFYPCKSCNKLFIKLDLLKSHVCPEPKEASREENSLYSCSICEKKFIRMNSLNKHISAHMLAGLSESVKSLLGSVVQKDLVVEQKNKKRYECKLCVKKYSGTRGLNRHMRSHTLERFESNISFSDSTNVQSVIFNENIDSALNDEEGGRGKCRRLYRCSFCEKQLPLYRLKLHLRMHTGEKPHGCDLCDMKFARVTSLKNHMLTHTGEKPFVCDMCKRAFARANDLKRHAVIHLDIRPYSCELCDKSFKQLRNLKNHMGTHSDEKRYKCQLCCKQFACPSGLRYHMLRHEDFKPYLCHVCHKQFTSMSYFNVHLRIHTDDKPYVPKMCTICNKQYFDRSSLRKHMLIHTGEKRFTCGICDKQFTYKNCLKYHMQVHTNEKPHQCLVCHKEFASLGYFKKHMRIHNSIM